MRMRLSSRRAVSCSWMARLSSDQNRSVLSPRVRVNSWAAVSDSILMENVEIGRHCVVRRAIIDKNVTIPPGTQIGVDLDEDRKRFHVTESGIVVIPKGAKVE